MLFIRTNPIIIITVYREGQRNRQAASNKQCPWLKKANKQTKKHGKCARVNTTKHGN